MALFEGLDPQRKYALLSKLSNTLVFEFTIRVTIPPVLFVVSGPNEGKSIQIDSTTPFIPSRFKIIDIGEAPRSAGVQTAAYRAETAWERVEKMMQMKAESERLKSMGSASSTEKMVPGSQPEPEESEISNAVFWGITSYPPSQRKTIIRQIYLRFFKGQHNLSANNDETFVGKFDERKNKLAKSLTEKGIDPRYIDFTAGWTELKNRDIIADRYRSAIEEFSSPGSSSPASSQPPNENSLSSGPSIENIHYNNEGGCRTRRLSQKMRKSRFSTKRTNGLKRTRSRLAGRRR